MNRIVRLSLALTAFAVVAQTPSTTAHGQNENPWASPLGANEPIGEIISFSPPENPFGDLIEFPGGTPEIGASVFTFNPLPGINHDVVPPGVIENPGLWSSDGVDDPSATEGPALVAKFFIDGGVADTERYVEAFVGWNHSGLPTFPGDPALTNDPVADLNNVIATRNEQGAISTNYDIFDGSAWNTFGNPATVAWVGAEDGSTITMYVPSRQFESMGETFNLTVFYGDLSSEPTTANFGFWSAEVPTTNVPTVTVDEIWASSGFDEALATALTTGQPLPQATTDSPDGEGATAGEAGSADPATEVSDENETADGPDGDAVTDSGISRDGETDDADVGTDAESGDGATVDDPDGGDTEIEQDASPPAAANDGEPSTADSEADDSGLSLFGLLLAIGAVVAAVALLLWWGWRRRLIGAATESAGDGDETTDLSDLLDTPGERTRTSFLEGLENAGEPETEWLDEDQLEPLSPDEVLRLVPDDTTVYVVSDESPVEAWGYPAAPEIPTYGTNEYWEYTAEQHNEQFTSAELDAGWRVTADDLRAASALTQTDAPAVPAPNFVDQFIDSHVEAIEFYAYFGEHLWDDVTKGRIRDRLATFLVEFSELEGYEESVAGMRDQFLTAYEGWGNILSDPSMLAELDDAAKDAVVAMKTELDVLADLARRDDPEFGKRMAKMTQSAQFEAVLGWAGGKVVMKIKPKAPGVEGHGVDTPRTGDGPDATPVAGRPDAPPTGTRDPLDVDAPPEHDFTPDYDEPLGLGDDVDVPPSAGADDVIDLGPPEPRQVFDPDAVDSLDPAADIEAIPNPKDQLAPADLRGTPQWHVDRAEHIATSPKGYGVGSPVEVASPLPGVTPTRLQPHVNSCVPTTIESMLTELAPFPISTRALTYASQRLGWFAGKGMILPGMKRVLRFLSDTKVIRKSLKVETVVFDRTRSIMSQLVALQARFPDGKILLGIRWKGTKFGHAVRFEGFDKQLRISISDPGLPRWISLRLPADVAQELIREALVITP